MSQTLPLSQGKICFWHTSSLTHIILQLLVPHEKERSHRDVDLFSDLVI